MKFLDSSTYFLTYALIYVVFREKYYKYKYRCDRLSLVCHALNLTLLTGAAMLYHFISLRVASPAKPVLAVVYALPASTKHGPAKPVFCLYRRGKLDQIIRVLVPVDPKLVLSWSYLAKTYEKRVFGTLFTS